MFSPEQVASIETALSHERLSTYEKTANNSSSPHSALMLYEWNAQISAALLLPEHICEVAMRNAAAAALEREYGPDWPWSASFERSLPNPTMTYSMKRNLLDARSRISDRRSGIVIARLNFKFWVNLFTARFQRRLWSKHLKYVLPALPDLMSIPHARELIHRDLDRIRRLRNRIAHHEPIFARDLRDDYACIRQLIAWRCATTASWVDSLETVSSTLLLNPRTR